MAVDRNVSPAHGGAFRRILIGFDGSIEAQHALRVGLELATELSGEVLALLVVRHPAHVETSEELARAADDERENLSRGLADFDTPAADARRLATEVIYADDPAEAIADYAEEHAFDLVVVGTHGREQMTHRGLGRSVVALLRRHPCPVLVV